MSQEKTPDPFYEARAFASGGYTLKAIAEQFWVHYSMVSRAVKEQEVSWEK